MDNMKANYRPADANLESKVWERDLVPGDKIEISLNGQTFYSEVVPASIGGDNITSVAAVLRLDGRITLA